jgi:hypothetical protein
MKLVVRKGTSVQLGMPKWARRVWPVEEGQPNFWEREEEFANQHVQTAFRKQRAAEETIDDIEAVMDDQQGLDLVHVVINGYHARLNVIYTEHRKAIRSIKDRYPNCR